MTQPINLIMTNYKLFEIYLRMSGFVKRHKWLDCVVNPALDLSNVNWKFTPKAFLLIKERLFLNVMNPCLHRRKKKSFKSSTNCVQFFEDLALIKQLVNNQWQLKIILSDSCAFTKLEIKIDNFEAFQEFVVFGEKMDLCHTVSS